MININDNIINTNTNTNHTVEHIETIDGQTIIYTHDKKCFSIDNIYKNPNDLTIKIVNFLFIDNTNKCIYESFVEEFEKNVKLIRKNKKGYYWNKFKSFLKKCICFSSC